MAKTSLTKRGIEDVALWFGILTDRQVIVSHAGMTAVVTFLFTVGPLKAHFDGLELLSALVSV
jgi:hypothetical protein